MAREDIIPQLLRQFAKKAGPPESDDNTILQKMVAPQDKAFLVDTAPVLLVRSVSGQKWGGLDTNGQRIDPGWSWGLGQWQ